jgi:DNA-binding transcriptional regulator YhcF (GntR family)
VQTIDISKILPLLGNISVRGRGYVEAVAKILQGQELTNAGLLELEQLDGAGGGSEVTNEVRALINKTWDVAMLKGFLKKEGPLSSGQMALKIGVNPDTIRRALMKESDVKRTGIGGATKWELLEKEQARKTIAARKAAKKTKAAKAKTSYEPHIDRIKGGTETCKRVLEAIQKDPYSTINTLSRKLSRGYYTISAIVKFLKKKDMVWETKKANPHLKGKFGEAKAYLEADPKAKIESEDAK